MPDKVKIETKLISGEATGRYGIAALVVLVVVICLTALAPMLLRPQAGHQPEPTAPGPERDGPAPV